VAEVTGWLKGLPTAKRPLVKTGVQIASDKAIEILLVGFDIWTSTWGGRFEWPSEQEKDLVGRLLCCRWMDVVNIAPPSPTKPW
jgi:hypothetical protein